MKKLLTATLYFLLLAPLSGFAARDGVLDERRSEGSIRISLAILPSLQISVVNQIYIDIQNVNADALFSEVVCITGPPGGKFSLVAAGNDGAFQLSSLVGQQLPYSVSYRGKDRTSFDQLQAGVPSPPYTLASKSSGCSQEDNFQILFKSEDLKVIQAGLYSGALTLMVSPL